MRLGVGEYNPPGFDTARFDARQAFINALLRLVPRIGETLTARLNALPEAGRTETHIYEVVAAWAAETGLPFDFVVSGIAGFDLYDAALPRDRRGRALNWGGRIAEGWFNGRNAEMESRGRARTFEDAAVQATTCKSLPFKFTHPGGDLARQTMVELKRDVLDAVNLALHDWVSSVRAEAKVHGWVARQSKRRPRNVGGAKRQATGANRRATRHFEWVVRFQVLGQPYSTIARDANVSDQSVAEAVRGTSQLLGITLRTSGKPGRPAKRSGAGASALAAADANARRTTSKD